MQVKLNDMSFSYDVHSLVKAFLPQEDVKVEDVESDDACTLSMSESEQCKNVELKIEIVDSKIDGEKSSGTIHIEGFGSEYTGSFEEMPRPDVKSRLKRDLYRFLSQYLDKELVWGTLTGIRPTKIPMKMIEEGFGDSEIKSYMKDTYLASDEKIKLAIDIAHTEKEILDNIHGSEGYSLYVGIPFCPSRCMYCSFTSYPIGVLERKVDDYLKALKKELSAVSDMFSLRRLDSVYIGGGTPTTLEPAKLRELIRYIKKKFDCSTVKEFTVEAGRPDSITKEKLQVLLDEGVSRISINPQTFNEKTLETIGRKHTVGQFEEAYKLARSMGFDNINMDLIIGLPGEDLEDVKYTLSCVKKFSPDSLTVHSMAIKRAALMHQFLMDHEEIKSVNTPQMMDEAFKCAKELGLIPYYLYRQKNMAGNFENVGYAKKDKLGIYNILIMEEVQDIVACGAGCVTKRVYGDGRIERCDTVKDVDLYINGIKEMINRKKKLFSDE